MDEQYNRIVNMTNKEDKMGRSLYDLVQASQERMIFTAPSPKCLVCDCLKYQGSNIVDLSTPWLCDNCKAILQKVVKKEQEGE